MEKAYQYWKWLQDRFLAPITAVVFLGPILGLHRGHPLVLFRGVLGLATGCGDLLYSLGHLKILYPNLRLTLVESVGKKAKFCRHLVSLLGLEHVTVIHARAEDLGQKEKHREKYDWAVARAVANLNVLSELLLPLVKMNGVMLAQKGESGPAEAQSAEKAMNILGGKLRQLIPVNLPGVVDDRYLILVDKVAATPPKYPRKPGIPAKQPL